jgi:hypothetical protein
MPRVVPTDITNLIDSRLSPHGSSPARLGRTQTPEIMAIIRLASELPDEFLVFSGAEYASYRVSISSLIDLLDFWKIHKDLPVSTLSYQEQRGVNAIETVRNLLSKCPDEIPSPLTAELSFIPDVDLRNNIRNDISAATRALHDGQWKAATVLAGAASEALLLWAITSKKTTTEVDTARQAVTPTAPQDPNRWDLDGYIKVARTLALIEDETKKQADLARAFRNFIHPGRSARLGKACDRGTALSALAAVELIVRDLS